MSKLKIIIELETQAEVDALYRALKRDFHVQLGIDNSYHDIDCIAVNFIRETLELLKPIVKEETT